MIAFDDKFALLYTRNIRAVIMQCHTGASILRLLIFDMMPVT